MSDSPRSNGVASYRLLTKSLNDTFYSCVSCILHFLLFLISETITDVLNIVLTMVPMVRGSQGKIGGSGKVCEFTSKALLTQTGTHNSGALLYASDA